MIYERMPIKDMISKGWLPPFENTNDLANHVKIYWRVDELDFANLDHQCQPFLARKSEAFNKFNAAYAFAWFQKAKVIAEKQPKLPYNREALESLYAQINHYTVADNGINLFIEKLAECGVIFFVLPHLQKTYLDGAAFFSGANPVVVYTARYKRVDNFWFTVAHEIAHILLHLNEEMPFFLDDLHQKNSDELESQANNLAAEKLKHPEIMLRMSNSTKYLPPHKVQDCADKLHIHPSIIIGKLAKENLISFANQNLYKENVIEQINDKFKF
jgi:HTH-type transcriptional regulator / antitoxin HigA